MTIEKSPLFDITVGSDIYLPSYQQYIGKCLKFDFEVVKCWKRFGWNERSSQYVHLPLCFTFALRQRATRGGDSTHYPFQCPQCIAKTLSLQAFCFCCSQCHCHVHFLSFIVLLLLLAISLSSLHSRQQQQQLQTWSLYTNSIQHFTCQSQPPSPRVPGTSCLLFYGSTLHFQQINLFVCNIFS